MGTAPDLRTIELPRELLVGGRDLAPELLGFVDLTVSAWMSARVLSKRSGYGFATTNIVPIGTLLDIDSDDFRGLLGYGIAAYGASAHYPWNALRKMRMLHRARLAGLDISSSLHLVRIRPRFPRDVITDEERAAEKAGGPIRWGDFPYGGAVYRTDGENEVMMGFSIWEQDEDNRMAGVTADRLLELAA